jgi:hypothetical protein
MVALSWPHRLLHRLLEPPTRPLRRLIVYYLAIGSVSFFLQYSRMFGPLEDRWSGVVLVRAMVTALVLMLPVAWVYLGTRRRRGPDHSVVQTILVLPVAVAGVILVVQNSLPLAFSLAGIIAAVRFRNTLKDPADMLFVFLAIAVGLAVGAHAFSAATLISVVFNLVVLALWHCDVAEALQSHAREGAITRPRVEPTVPPRSNGKRNRYTGVLAVQVADLENGQRAVEEVLRQEAQKWQIDEIKKKRDGRTTLRYVVRVDKSLPPELMLDAVLTRGAPYVLGVALN